MCRSRRELSNQYLLAKIGVDTAVNEPLEIWGKIQFIIHSPPKVTVANVSFFLRGPQMGEWAPNPALAEAVAQWDWPFGEQVREALRPAVGLPSPSGLQPSGAASATAAALLVSLARLA